MQNTGDPVNGERKSSAPHVRQCHALFSRFPDTLAVIVLR